MFDAWFIVASTLNTISSKCIQINETNERHQKKLTQQAKSLYASFFIYLH